MLGDPGRSTENVDCGLGAEIGYGLANVGEELLLGPEILDPMGLNVGAHLRSVA
jgi:hypothetical protein